MQAILILAHNNPKQVTELSKILRKKFEVYIHFDKKYNLTEEDKSEFSVIGVNCIQECDVKWGAFSIVDASCRLMKKALENKEITHFHLISGQDWPVRSIDDIYNFYENNTDIYMACEKAEDVKKSGEPIILWQKYYFNYDKINRRTTFGKIFHRVSFLVQTVLGINKFKKLKIDKEIYQGSQWIDLPRDAAEFLIKEIEENSSLRKLFETGFCSDEFWAQTILYNSEYKARIVQNNHRFILWEQRYNSYPAILDERDFNDIIKGDYHFARKIDSNHSMSLRQRLSQIYSH